MIPRNTARKKRLEANDTAPLIKRIEQLEARIEQLEAQADD